MALNKPSEKRIRDLWSEIKMAEKFNEEELKPIGLEAIQRYTGDYYPKFGGDWDIILNEVYPIIQNNLPSIFFRNPRAFLKPRNKTYIAKKRDPVTGNMEEVEIDSTKSAKTQEAILNYQIHEIKYKEENRKVLLDALLFPHGVLWHGYKGEFGMTEEQSVCVKQDAVFVKRISPMRFLKDPAVTFSNLDEAEWVGRTIDIRLRDLIEDDKLDVDKKLIKGFEGFGTKVGLTTVGKERVRNGLDVSDIHRGSMIDFADKDFKKSSSARFVKIHEIFLRPTKKEKRDGSKGWILLLTEEQTKPLRVNPWSIKAEGFPAHLLEFNQVPDRMLGIDDVSTYSSIADQKNIITNLQIRNAQENTKVWVGINKAGADEEDIQHVQQGQNTIILFDGDQKVGDRMFVASPGAQASSELYLIDQRIQRNLEDKSGVSDLKRGFLQSGEESATSVKIRAAGSSARPAYRQDIQAEFLRGSLHYITQLNKQFLPFKEAVRIIGSLDLEWSDNPSKEELQADTDVEIDVISMLPENPEEELRRLNETLALLIQGITIPEVAQKIAQEGKVINLSPIIEQVLIRQRIRDPEIFRSIKPEESEGFVSVSELRAAEQNIQAALQGKPPPSPPEEGQDHRARLEIYNAINNLLKQAKQQSEVLSQLIQIQSALLQAEQDKEASPGTRPKFKRGGVENI